MCINFFKKFKKYRINFLLMALGIGVLIDSVANYFVDLTRVFGNPGSYVYYYSFSTIVQGFIALLALLGMLTVFRLQRIQTKRDILDRGLARPEIEDLDSNMTWLMKDLINFLVVCFADVATALVGIILIPAFISSWIGPLYLISNTVLSIEALFLSRPIISKFKVIQ